MDKSSRKQLKGIVLDSKMEKTAVVEVARRIPHPVYKKYIIKSKKYYAHDSENKTTAGDRVVIVESRPRSKMKKWFVKEIQKNS
ncbi:MAG: 30S ribosomal protein S17 [Candidatus Marinimicrobia bacterium]|nr:30S ribosomal protein S17 [Candidatus Neomarinimicrobiota bacterium]|tara:strand:+ start:39 stop:290 length:252 start_codon:yes stop_codon:yes gene_type:complete